MAPSSWTIYCFLAAFCIMAEAHNGPHHHGPHHHGPHHNGPHHNVNTKPIQKSAGPPQKQTMFDFPVEQGTGPSVAGPSFGASSLSYMNIDSSSEEESDYDMDTDMDTNDADSALSFIFGRNGNQISGNMRPLFPGNSQRQRVLSGDQAEGDHGKLLGRAAGSSGRGVGIAFGVLGLLALVVAAVYLTIRKHRHNIPVLVRT